MMIYGDMENCWNTLKSQGLFSSYSSYEEYLEKKGYSKTPSPIQEEAMAQGEIDVDKLPLV